MFGCTHIRSNSNIVVVFAPDDDTVFFVQNGSKCHFYHLRHDSETDTVIAEHFKSTKKIPVAAEAFEDGQRGFHSCISNDLDHFIFFVDRLHIYKYNTKHGTTERFLNHRIQGLYLLDDNYCYTLSHSSPDRRSGIRLYDLNNMISVNSDNSYHLTNIQVGFNNKIDYSRSNSRLTL